MRETSWNSTIKYHTGTHKKFPGKVQGVGWGSYSSQINRFAILIEAIKNRSSKDSILDVGCGYGDLYKMITWTSHYCGIDINPLMIKTAKNRYPNLSFKAANFIDEHKKYDWVLASGVITVKTDNNEKLLRESIKKMWDLSKKGIAFNILVEGSDVKDEKMYFYDSGQVLNYCRSLTSKVVCRIDYLPHDATFYLYR